MAEQVTDKLEKKLQEVPYIDKIRSYSKPGESLIIIELRGSTPPREVPGAFYQTRKKIGDIAGTLPAGVQGPFFNDEFGDVFGTIYALAADGFSYEETRRYADFVRQQFLRVPKVAKVQFFGVQDEKVFVEFSHRRFSQLGLDFNAMVAQIAAQNAVEPTGVLVTPSDNLQVTVTGQLATVEGLRELVLRPADGGNANGASGASMRLGDFATVRRGYLDPPHDKMRFQGRDVIGIGISMAKDGDIIELGKRLRAKADELRAKLPVGMEIEQVQDQPRAVSASVNEFVRALIEAVVVVLAVSFLALGLHRARGTRFGWRLDVRPGLVVGLTIPLVLGVTFLSMQVLGIGLHKISLGALIVALGLLVDDAIIAVEMMVRKLEEGYSKVEAAGFAYRSTAMPMLTGTLITAAGFLPVGLAKSLAGEYTFAIFAVTTIALVLSWFAAVIFVPFLGFHLLRTTPADASAPHEHFDTPFYARIRRWIDRCVTWRKSVIAVTVLLFALAIVGFRFIEQQFFPDSTRPELMVDIWLPEGASFQQTEASAQRVEAYARGLDGVASTTTFIGTGAPRFYLPLDQILPQTNAAQLMVIARDLTARSAVKAKLEEAFRKDFPEVRGRVKLLPNGPPVAYPVQFRIEGPDIPTVRRIADDVKGVMQKNRYAVGVNDNWNESVKTIRLDVDQDKARALGLSSQAIAQTVRVVLTGRTIGSFREEDRTIDIVARQPSAERDAVSDLMQAEVRSATGRYVPLSQVARASFDWQPGVIWRQNRDFAITAQCDIADGVQGPTVASQIDGELAAIRASLPAGYRIVVAGATEQSAEANQAIAAGFPLMLFIMFTLLMLQLGSFSKAALAFLTGFLGLIGVALALLVFRAPFGFVALLGTIALFGMIVRNSVILIDQIDQDTADGHDRWTAIVESAVRRFRPIVLTAAAAVLAMIPLSRSVFWGPMAKAIMGGLVVATALTLLFLPALYAAWFRVRRGHATLVPDPVDVRSAHPRPV